MQICKNGEVHVHTQMPYFVGISHLGQPCYHLLVIFEILTGNYIFTNTDILRILVLSLGIVLTNNVKLFYLPANISF